MEKIEKNPKSVYPTHWLNKIIEEIELRNTKEIALSTGKTPSGHIHMGILREIIICDSLRKFFQNQDKKVKFRLFFDDLDAAKRFPSYIPKEHASKNLGIPFAFQPDPFNKTKKSYAEVMGDELTDTFREIGIVAEIVWTHNIYKKKGMKDKIRIALKKNELAKTIISSYLTASMTEEQREDYYKQQESWTGVMVVCEKCSRILHRLEDGSIKPNRAIKYWEQSDEVEYVCSACGY